MVTCNNYQANDYAISTYGSELAGDCTNCMNCGGSLTDHPRWLYKDQNPIPQPDGNSDDLCTDWKNERERIS